MLRVVVDESARPDLTVGLDEISAGGRAAQLAAALDAEVEAHLAAHADERDEGGSWCATGTRGRGR